jgi:hypothetical protein
LSFALQAALKQTDTSLRIDGEFTRLGTVELLEQFKGKIDEWADGWAQEELRFKFN